MSIDSRRWYALAVVLAAVFLAAFEFNVVTVAIPSMLCGFARSPTALVGSRLLRGAFAAVMVPQALSFIQVTFTPREQSLAYPMYGMTIGFGMIAGQLLGGLLLSVDLLGLAWRPVFLVNLPFGVVAITLAWWLVRESRAPA